MIVGVPAFAEHVLIVVAFLLQGRDHRLILEVPVALGYSGRGCLMPSWRKTRIGFFSAFRTRSG